MNTADTIDHWSGPAWGKSRRWQYSYAAMAKLRRSYR